MVTSALPCAQAVPGSRRIRPLGDGGVVVGAVSDETGTVPRRLAGGRALLLPSGMSLSSETTTRFVRDIVDRVSKGHVQIPSFQRGLVWRSQQVIELLDSVRRGYPIGTLLLWKKQGTAGSLRVGPLHITTVAVPDAWFVVDGQQRMMALTATLTRQDDRPAVDIYAAWFDLETQEFFYNNGRRSLATAVPANALGNHTRLLQWARTWPLQHERPDLVTAAFNASDALLNYAVSTFITSTSDETEVRELFRRANSSGVKMRESEVFEGKHGGDAGGLEALRHRLGDVGFHGASGGDVPEGDTDGIATGRDDRPLLFRCWKAVNRYDPRLTAEKSPRPTAGSLDATESAIRRSVAFIVEHAGFPGVSFLPYRNVLVPLARFFSVYPDPSPRTRQLLCWFLWRGALSGEHAQSSHPWVEQLCGHVDHDPEQAALAWLGTVTPYDGRPFDWTAPWNARAAHTRLGAAMLWHLIGGGAEPLGEPLGTLFTPAIKASSTTPLGVFIGRRGETPGQRRRRIRAPEAQAERQREHLPEAALPALLADDIDALLRHRVPALAVHSAQLLEARAGVGAKPRRSIDGMRHEAVAR
jgi:hypothetical protein